MALLFAHMVFLCYCTVHTLSLTVNYDQQVEKNVFVVFYSGERAKNKILKICEAFGANRYSFPEDLGRQAQMITEVFTMVSLWIIWPC